MSNKKVDNKNTNKTNIVSRKKTTCGINPPEIKETEKMAKLARAIFR